MVAAFNRAGQGENIAVRLSKKFCTTGCPPTKVLYLSYIVIIFVSLNHLALEIIGVEQMKIEDRLKVYTAYTEISRKWTTAMDAKGAFLSALNGAILAFSWSGLKVEQWGGTEKYFALGATAFSIVALIAALLVITPREKPSLLVGRKSPWTSEYKPLSFYGYIAKKYGADGYKSMVKDFRELEDEGFAYEALEQHLSISCVVQRKSNWVYRAAILTLVSLTCIGTAMFIKII
jgi:hypothetical protein